MLVGGLAHSDYFSIQEESSQLTNAYFSEGWLNQQPETYDGLYGLKYELD
jgi:hypothetical protein